MPGQRSPNQKLIPVQMNVDFVDEIDKAVTSSGYSDRAKFIRDAIVEKLGLMGIKLPKEMTSAPSKMGKGGRPSIKYPPSRRPVHSLNDKTVNSKPPSDAATLTRRASGEGKRRSK